MTICTATTKANRPCKARARPGSDPPRCAAHSGSPGGAPPANQNRRTHGLYSAQFTQEEVAALEELIKDNDLSDEIALAKIINRRAIRYLTHNPDMPASEFVAMANVALTGTGRVAALMRAWQALAANGRSSAAAAIASALDQLATEWEMNL